MACDTEIKEARKNVKFCVSKNTHNDVTLKIMEFQGIMCMLLALSAF